MNWKEFLKPDWPKLITFIFIGHILSFVRNLFFLPQYENPIAFSIFNIIISPFLNLLLQFLPFELIAGLPILYMFMYNLFFLIVGILDAIYLYILTSVIVFVYRKIKK